MTSADEEAGLEEDGDYAWHRPRYFLFIGGRIPEAATSRVRASGVAYEHKRLESGADNWAEIADKLSGGGVIACVAKMTGKNFKTMVMPQFEAVTEPLIEAIGRTRHIVLVHEQALTGEPGEDDPPNWDEEPWEGYRARYEPPSKEVREYILSLFEKHSINFVPYDNNAELAVLAAQFIEENERNLLLRVYVPAGRLFAEEAGRLLGLFRDWLSQATDVRVSQRTYASGHGQVYELVGDDRSTTMGLSDQFNEFQRFLDLCEERSEDAVSILEGLLNQADRSRAEGMVAKYARESRRLKRDLRQSRDRKVLELKYQLEEELDEDLADRRELEAVIEALVPGVASYAMALNPTVSPGTVVIYNEPTINNQLIQKVAGPVMQNVQGDARLGPDALELIALIRELGGHRASELESAVHELEDEAASNDSRLRARQKLKGFLIAVSARVGEAALEVAEAWVESKVVQAG